MPLPDGTLHKLPKLAKRGLIPHDHLREEVLRQVLCALDYLDFHNQCHRDIKPQNILYSDLGNGNCLFPCSAGRV